MRLVPRHAPHFRRANRRREWHVTVPAPRVQAWCTEVRENDFRSGDPDPVGPIAIPCCA